MKNTFKTVSFGALLAVGLLSTAYAKELPERSVFGTSPPASVIVYTLDPTKLAGTTYPLTDNDSPFLDPLLLELPEVGGWHGQGKTPNMEVLLTIDPKLILVWNLPVFRKRLDKTLSLIGRPVLYLPLSDTTKLPENYRKLGEALGMQERANLLADYAEEKLLEMEKLAEKIPLSKRKRLYYAQGPAGIETECNDSFHAEVMNLASAYNVHQCEQSTVSGKQAISMEDVMIYNPEAIMVYRKDFYESIYDDKRWKGINAVKNKQVFLMPNKPFSWFDRPPSLMRLLGMQWLASKLYPEEYPIDLEAEVKRFFALFFNQTLSDEDVKQMLDS